MLCYAILCCVAFIFSPFTNLGGDGTEEKEDTEHRNDDNYTNNESV